MITRREIADPLVEIREVLETYRSYGITLSNWTELLAVAADQLDSAAALVDDIRQPAVELSAKIRLLIADGLRHDDPTFVAAAELTSELVSSIRIRGIPTPEDNDWHFDSVV